MNDDRISNENGYITHVTIGETFDHKMFRTEFHTSGNSGVKLPDYYKDEKSTLSKARHQLVKSICNFIVYVQKHMKKRDCVYSKKITITDMETKKEFSIYVFSIYNFFFARSIFFERVNEQLPKKFIPKVYMCSVTDRPETWFQVCIY